MLLEKLIEFGLKKGFFVLKPLGILNSIPVPEVDVEVIDFDYTKERVCDEKKLQMVSSCDALKILPDLNRVDFIELKSITNYLIHNDNDADALKRKIRSFNFEDKIQDSHFLLQTIAFNNLLNLTREERRAFHLIEKNYFIVIDTDIEERGDYSLAVTMDYLSKTSSEIHQELKLIVEDEVGGIDTIEVKKPRIIGIKGIQKLYKELLG